MAKALALTASQVKPHMQRFLAFIEKESENSCWYRPNRARDNGYTTITINGKSVQSHRFSYAAFKGSIKSSQEIDHLCRDRACVNPNHLELVSRKENVRRRDDIYSLTDSSAKPIDRIMRRVTKAKNSCWVWNGGLVRGYGVVSVLGKTKYVHRIVFEHFVGEFDQKLTLDHLCRNPRCVNPKHLELVTRSENIKRMNSSQPKTRCRKGHYYALVGRTKGSCSQCFKEYRKRLYGDSVKDYKPRRIDRTTHCSNGHEYHIVGKFKTGGCRKCQADKDYLRGKRKSGGLYSQLCARGHDTWMTGRLSTGHCKGCFVNGICSNGHDTNVDGKSKNGNCNACLKKSRATYAVRVKTNQFCPNGHDTFKLGRSKTGACKACNRNYARRKYGYKLTIDELKLKCRNGHIRKTSTTKIVTRVRNGIESSHQECIPCDKLRKQRYIERKKNT